MSMTETRSEADAETATVPEDPMEPTGLAGFFSTADHKRIGRFYLATSLVFLVGAAVTNALLRVEGISSGLTLFDEGTFAQVHNLHSEIAVLLFLVPFFIGLATYLVPLQIGSPDIAFARGAAAAYWTYLLSGLVLIGAYVADGGITGGSTIGVDLYLLSTGALTVAFVVALISILTTVVSLRAPGMSLDRAPLFTWSVLVGGGLLLLTSPVLLGRVVELFLGHRNGGEIGSYEAISWFWSVPTVYLLAVPAIGVILEIVAVSSGVRYRMHAAAMILVAAVGILGFGAFAQVEEARTGWSGLIYIALGLAALLPVLALVGLVGDTLRRGRLVLRASLLLAIGALVHLFLGALAGAALVIEPLDLTGTVWEAAQLHYLVYGAGVLGALAALWFWAPKIWGIHLGEAVGKIVFALVFLGAILLAAPDLVNGLVNDIEAATPTFDDDGLAVALNVASLAGAALVAAGVLLTFGDVLGRAGRRQGKPAIDDPWGGHTLEWATTSPPPRSNFAGAIPVVTSPTPVLDTRTTETEVSA
jgi:cytochrome c oxidase subunit I